jgi:hypothetical protein
MLTSLVFKNISLVSDLRDCICVNDIRFDSVSHHVVDYLVRQFFENFFSQGTQIGMALLDVICNFHKLNDVTDG